METFATQHLEISGRRGRGVSTVHRRVGFDKSRPQRPSVPDE